MIIHLVDGTYELFRHFYGLRRVTTGNDRPYGGGRCFADDPLRCSRTAPRMLAWPPITLSNFSQRVLARPQERCCCRLYPSLRLVFQEYASAEPLIAATRNTLRVRLRVGRGWAASAYGQERTLEARTPCHCVVQSPFTLRCLLCAPLHCENVADLSDSAIPDKSRAAWAAFP